MSNSSGGGTEHFNAWLAVAASTRALSRSPSARSATTLSRKLNVFSAPAIFSPAMALSMFSVAEVITEMTT